MEKQSDCLKFLADLVAFECNEALFAGKGLALVDSFMILLDSVPANTETRDPLEGFLRKETARPACFEEKASFETDLIPKYS